MTLHRWLGGVCGALVFSACFAGGCGSSDDSSTASDASTDSPSSNETSSPLGDASVDTGVCATSCSATGNTIVDCSQKVTQTCSATQACDPSTVTCVDQCALAAKNPSSVGCDFYATDMEQETIGQCFAAYVVNTTSAPAHISAQYDSANLNVADFTRIQAGIGSAITYGAYDADAGIPAGKAAVLFLAGSEATDACPVTPAETATTISFAGTSIGKAFHITTDIPVSAYEINPYGISKSTPGASLLLPTSTWGTNYLVVTAAPDSVAPPSFNVVASQDNTVVTLLPSVAVAGGGTLLAGAAGTPYTFTLQTGEHAQFSQSADLTTSLLQATHPVAVLAGNACMEFPSGISFCDHGEQMLPPISAIGHTYAAVQFRPRITGDSAIWRFVGAADGTTLTYSSTIAGSPSTLNAGQEATITTDQAFAVASQDAMHPFLLFTEMSSSEAIAGLDGYGDPDFVLVPAVEQLTNHYSFVTDPTYPENDLVMVRTKNTSGSFDDVTLDCAGTLGGWQTFGDYEWTRVDLTSHDFAPQGSCTAGPHSITSKTAFSVTVWGWGTPESSIYTEYTSYGFPAGMNVKALDTLVLDAGAP